MPTRLWPARVPRRSHCLKPASRALHNARPPRRPLHSASSISAQSAEQRVPSSAPSEPTPTPSTSKPSSVTLPPPLAVKNVLKEAASVLRRLAPQGVGEGAVPWAKFAERAAEDLGAKRRARIAIVGDRLAGTRELVTALLDDPFSPSHRRKAIWTRWDGLDGEEVVRIQHGNIVNAEGGMLTIPAPWLDKDGAELFEVVSSDLTKHIPLLVTMDSILLVTDSTRLLSPLSQILPHLPISPLAPTSLQLVINRLANHSFSYTPSEEDARVAAALEAYYRGAPHPTVTTVSSSLALEALEAFQSSASPNTDAVRTFQAKYVGSRITHLQTALSRPLPDDFQVNTAAGIASAAVGAANFGVVEAEQEVEDARRKAMWLQGEAERELGKWSEVKELEEQADKAEGIVQAALARYAFWKLPWKVDDLGTEVRETIERTYGRELERKLCHDAGRLKEIQADFSTTTTRTLDSFAGSSDLGPSPFFSPLLLNKIAQLTSLTTLTPTSLLYPIFHRRHQLIQPGGPVDHLHLRAQKLVLAAWASFIGSPLAGLAGWTIYDIQTGTAVAAVSFVWAGTAWWCQGNWRKGLKRFWQDWARVEKGLDVDLKTELQEVVRAKVLAKPLTAAEGIQELVSRRETVLGPIKHDLRSAQKKLDEVVHR
ncbi:hypothetical protein CALCODRAFT_75224 [Calocera cornea HHB12733]|uniref:Mmc1 C-terminal domain-containing protein n=1 Tax=Calocera cornea HHB12733 TaxID=1353952 RepID=A0A165DID9_9BASI|nr:hypothetical protein CALCODRAFT_75224 [Calocera cornea HHB12733]